LPVGEAAVDEALHLVHGGRVFQGFRAVARTFEVLPLSFAVAPLLRLPPIAHVGERVYARVAAGRKCRVVVPFEPDDVPSSPLGSAPRP
jgi:predicted DCC family thiol-disulfide oxidoreductase YuxK